MRGEISLHRKLSGLVSGREGVGDRERSAVFLENHQEALTCGANRILIISG